MLTRYESVKKCSSKKPMIQNDPKKAKIERHLKIFKNVDYYIPSKKIASFARKIHIKKHPEAASFGLSNLQNMREQEFKMKMIAKNRTAKKGPSERTLKILKNVV